MVQLRNTLGLRPLTARSVLLSTLLGMQPPALDGRALVASGEVFGIAAGTTRVALSRMVAAGELVTEGGRYALTGRLLQRQARQNAALRASAGPWDGTWRTAIVRQGARSPDQRAALRRAMHESHFAEVRDGVWTRPAHLIADIGAAVATQCLWLTGRPDDDPVALAAKLWDLDVWANTGRELVRQMTATSAALDARDTRALRATFLVAAAVTHHLNADPLLPATLTTPDWPGSELRKRYERYQRSFAATWRAWYRGWQQKPA